MGTLVLLLLLGQDTLPFQAAQTQVCDPTTPNQCAPVSSTAGLKVDGTGATQPITGTVAVDGGSLSISNLPAVQPVSGTVAVSNLPRTLSGALRVDASGTTTPIAAAALPLPTGAALEAGNLASIAASLTAISANLTNGTQIASGPVVKPLNPFLPRCNPVVRTNCQP